MHIDSHVHVVSPDQDRYPLNPSGITEDWYLKDPCSIERLLGLMDEADVDAAVLVQAVSAYQHDNRYCAEAAHRFRERCTSVGCVEVTAAVAVDHARDLVEQEGMRGIRWMAIRGEGVKEPRALWEQIFRLGVPAVVTILPDRLAELAETISSIPAIPLALDHCAFVAYSSGIPPELLALAEFPTLHLKVSTNALDLMAQHAEPAEIVAELAVRFGADRLLWGSDYSQTYDRPYGELVEWGRAATRKLSDEQRAWVLGRTALKLWSELAR